MVLVNRGNRASGVCKVRYELSEPMVLEGGTLSFRLAQ